MTLMDTVQLLGNVGVFLSAIAVVVTLGYLAVQIRNARADIDANAFNTTSNNFNTVQAMFLENAELWTKGNAGQELDESETFAFETLTDLRVQHAFFAFRRSLALKNGREDIHAINTAIFFVEHPNAYQRWLQREKATRLLRKSAGWTIDMGFVEIVEAAVESMKSGARSECDAVQNRP